MIHLSGGKPVEGARVRVYSAIISLKAQAGERSREMKNAILCTVTMVLCSLVFRLRLNANMAGF